jgi:hypothetical protein
MYAAQAEQVVDQQRDGLPQAGSARAAARAATSVFDAPASRHARFEMVVFDHAISW